MYICMCITYPTNSPSVCSARSIAWDNGFDDWEEILPDHFQVAVEALSCAGFAEDFDKVEEVDAGVHWDLLGVVFAYCQKLIYNLVVVAIQIHESD